MSTSRSVLASPPRMMTAASPLTAASIAATVLPFVRKWARPPKRPAVPCGDGASGKRRFNSTLRASLWPCASPTSRFTSTVMFAIYVAVRDAEVEGIELEHAIVDPDVRGEIVHRDRAPLDARASKLDVGVALAQLGKLDRLVGQHAIRLVPPLFRVLRSGPGTLRLLAGRQSYQPPEIL